MLNAEKYRKTIIETEGHFGLSIDTKTPKLCCCKTLKCDDCQFDPYADCSNQRIKWLLEEYKEPKVDWSKVPVDTKILVSFNGDTWFRRHFAKYQDDMVYAYDNGITSWSGEASKVEAWNYAKLTEEE